MPVDELPSNEPASSADDAQPGIAGWLLAAMALLFIVVSYQFVSDRLDPPHPRLESAQTQPQPAVRGD
jgi:hypothetical protein